MRWKPLPIPEKNPESYYQAIRLNALGSLFFFVKFVLGKHRLARLHYEMCMSLETEDLHLVLEMPMGHFKTTVGTEGLSMWWALPFTAKDEYLMRQLGYSDEWIQWMKKAHDQNTRTVITHAVESRAIAMGKAVDDHYLNNDIFRSTFSDIIPGNATTWNDHTKFQKRVGRSDRSDATTGTFEYRGVGSAIQGVHADGIIQDDNFGKAEQFSVLQGDGRVKDDLIRWHGQLCTRFDSHSFTKTGIGRQLVIGNRWAHDDLNSYIKMKQPEFKFETHSAEGGCCKRHPTGQPIFPEEWTWEKLKKEQQTLGPYDYAHFMLNQSVLPEECIFKKEWIKHYRFKASRPDLPLDDPRNVLMIEHEVYDGQPVEDIACGELSLRMIIDLAHAKKRKRCKHVILIIGLHPETDRFYLLDVWAKPAPYSDLVGMMYKMAPKWGIGEAFLETVAAQNLLKFHIEEKNKMPGVRPLYIQELKYDNSENAKKNRIEAMEPTYRNGQFWCHRSHVEFHEEYDIYPACSTVDVLDTIGYAPQTFEIIRRRELMEAVASQYDAFSKPGARSEYTGY